MSIFDGDGRKTLHPNFKLPGALSGPVRRSTARLIIEGFERSGRSHHSGMGTTVWVVLQHLHETGQSYAVTAHPGFGFEIRLLDPL